MGAVSTRSHIGILNGDGTATVVYCHFDGYPEHNGKILHTHYPDEGKVRALVALGHLSRLDEDGDAVAYHRDRGEPYESNAPATEPVSAFTEASVPYLYLFDPAAGAWLWRYRHAADTSLMRLTPDAWASDVT